MAFKDDFVNLVKNSPVISQLNIETMASQFIKEYHNVVAINCQKAYSNTDPLTIKSFEMTSELKVRSSIISYINKYKAGKVSLQFIDIYLIECLKNCGRAVKLNYSTGKVAICRGCESIDASSGMPELLIINSNNKYTCNKCSKSLTNPEAKYLSNLEAYSNLWKTFAVHSRHGFRCRDCRRFIPKKEGKSNVYSCPYIDCTFVGTFTNDDLMAYPKKLFSSSFPELLVLDKTFKDQTVPSASRKEALSDNETSYYDIIKFEGNSRKAVDTSSSTGCAIEQSFEYVNDLRILKDVVNQKMGQVEYESNQSSLVHKTLMYQAFKNLIESDPQDCVAYFVRLHRNVGIQHRIFKEYVRLIEEKIPFVIVRQGEMVTIDCLDHPKLGVFSGKTKFTAQVGPKGEIPNKTPNLYVGGRSASLIKNYFIGKVLSIKDQSGVDITSEMQTNTFFNITMNPTVVLGTTVDVEHLMVPPHFQMLSMAILQRARRKIVDRIHQLKNNGAKRRPSR